MTNDGAETALESKKIKNKNISHNNAALVTKWELGNVQFPILKDLFKRLSNFLPSSYL